MTDNRLWRESIANNSTGQVSWLSPFDLAPSQVRSDPMTILACRKKWWFTVARQLTICTWFPLRFPFSRENRDEKNFQSTVAPPFAGIAGHRVAAANIHTFSKWCQEKWRKVIVTQSGVRAFHLYCLLAFLSVIITYFGVNFLLGGVHAYN